MKKLNLKEAMRSRTFRVGGYSLIACAVVLVIAVLVNLLAGAIPADRTQFDLTSSGLFSVSKDSREFLKDLDEDVDIYWLCQAGTEDETIRQLLDSYVSLSKHLSLTKIDPDANPTFAVQYTSEQIGNNSLIVSGEKRSRYISPDEIYVTDYSSYYMTGSYEVSFDGEGQLSSAIDYCISDDLPKLYLLTGHGEKELSEDFALSVDRQNVQCETLSLLTLSEVPEDADAILIYAPASDLSDRELELLMDYLDRAGDVILIHGVLNAGHLANFEALGARFGVSMEDGIVIEGSQTHCAFGEPYYLLPDIDSHAMTGDLRSSGYAVVLPMSAGLTVEENEEDGIEVSRLLGSSADSYVKSAGLNITTYDREDGDKDGPFALAVCAREDLGTTTPARLVWVSCIELLSDDANSLVSGGNQRFFLSILANVCEEKGSSVVVPTKSLSLDRLTMNTAQEIAMVVLTVVLLPLAYLCIGILVRVRRKRR